MVVYPQSWNVGEWAFACDRCNLPAEQGVNDVLYFNTLIDVLETDLNADSRRIYISGFSQGGLMTTRLSCDLKDRIAAVGIVGAIAWDWHMARCSNDPIATMWMMGTFDNQFPWTGTPGEIVSQIPGETMRVQWAERNGCSPDPVETPLPDLDEGDGTTAVLIEHQGCAKEFTFYRFDEMDHNWPGSSIVVAGKTNRDVHASGELARFFLRTTR